MGLFFGIVTTDDVGAGGGTTTEYVSSYDSDLVSEGAADDVLFYESFDFIEL